MQGFKASAKVPVLLDPMNIGVWASPSLCAYACDRSIASAYNLPRISALFQLQLRLARLISVHA